VDDVVLRTAAFFRFLPPPFPPRLLTVTIYTAGTDFSFSCWSYEVDMSVEANSEDPSAFFFCFLRRED